MITLPDSTPGRTRLGQRRRLASAAAAALAGLLAAAGPATAQADTQTFTTPGSSVYTVPAGVTGLSITAIGAAGGGWCANGGGGSGASVSGSFPVTASEQLTVSVGGVGGVCGTSVTPGGAGGGGSANLFGGGGGGASGVSIGTSTPTPGSELIVAGGGGGAGGAGGPGGNAGAPGTDPNGLVTPAQPGTQTAGGTAASIRPWAGLTTAAPDRSAPGAAVATAPSPKRAAGEGEGDTTAAVAAPPASICPPRAAPAARATSLPTRPRRAAPR